MGLDTTHGCWHGAYSAFYRWRGALARSAGIGERTFTWHGRDRQEADIDWESITEANLAGEWNECPDDPLIILIAHSDCDGLIMHEHTIALAERLEELLPALTGMDLGGHVGNVVEKTQTFIDGLHCAFEACEDVEFH